MGLACTCYHLNLVLNSVRVRLNSECLAAEVDLACGFNLRSLIFRNQFEVIEQPSTKLAPKSSGDPKTFPHGRVTGPAFKIDRYEGKLEHKRHGPLRELRFHKFDPPEAEDENRTSITGTTEFIENRPGYYPMDYAARATTSLHNATVVQTTTITNRSPAPLPSWFGQHTHFATGYDGTLCVTINADHVWDVDEYLFPRKLVAVDASNDCRGSRQVSGHDNFDTAYWPIKSNTPVRIGVAMENGHNLVNLEYALKGWSECGAGTVPFTCAQLWVPPRDSTVAVELASDCPDALHLFEQGLRSEPPLVLKQGETVSFHVEMNVSVAAERQHY